MIAAMDPPKSSLDFESLVDILRYRADKQPDDTAFIFLSDGGPSKKRSATPSSTGVLGRSAAICVPRHPRVSEPCLSMRQASTILRHFSDAFTGTWWLCRSILQILAV